MLGFKLNSVSILGPDNDLVHEYLDKFALHSHSHGLSPLFYHVQPMREHMACITSIAIG